MVFAAAAICALSALSHPSHEDYMRQFGKKYTSDEQTLRARIFAENLARIDAQNALPDQTWTAGINEYTDWSNEEFRSKRTGTRPMFTGLPMPTADLQAPPADAIDWRTKDGVLTKVKDQQSCGSCWAFSAVETFESAVAIATGKPAPVLSPQQVVSCSGNPNKCGGTGGCQGSTQQLAFNYTETAGMTTEEDYPYTGRTGTCQQSKIKPVAINSGYVTVPLNDYNALIAAVNLGPVAITVAAGGFGWQLYNGGVLDCKNDYTLDHGVQLVGYGESSKDGKYWIVRNSWGARWGEQGFIRLKRFGDGSEPCGDDTKPADGIACNGNKTVVKYCGSCGLMASSSYPTGVKTVGPSPGPSPPAPSGTRWHCDKTSKTCVKAASGHSTEAKCEAACGNDVDIGA